MRKFFFLVSCLLLISLASYAQEPAPPPLPTVESQSGFNWESAITRGGLAVVALGLVFKYVVNPIVEHSLRMQDRLVASNELLSQAISGISPSINKAIAEAEYRLEGLIRDSNDEMKFKLTEILELLKNPPASSGSKKDS